MATSSGLYGKMFIHTILREKIFSIILFLYFVIFNFGNFNFFFFFDEQLHWCYCALYVLHVLGKYNLPHIWDRILFTIPELKLKKWDTTVSSGFKTSMNPNGITTLLPTTGSNTLRTKHRCCTIISVQPDTGTKTSVPILQVLDAMHNNISAT